MTKQEFFERTKLDLNDEVYADVERIYMAAGDDMDKDSFCSLYKGLNKSGYNLAMQLTSTIEALQQKIKAQQSKINELNGEQREVAEFLVGKASVYNDTDSYWVAEGLIGQKAIALYKIKNNLPLWDEDVKYLEDALTD